MFYFRTAYALLLNLKLYQEEVFVWQTDRYKSSFAKTLFWFAGNIFTFAVDMQKDAYRI